MRWTQQMLAHYIGRVRTIVEFEGITEEGLTSALHEIAMYKLKRIEEIVYDSETTDHEKVMAVMELLGERH